MITMILEALYIKSLVLKHTKQNVIIERKHQHIFNLTYAFLFQSKLTNQIWCYAIIHVLFFL